MSPSDEESYLFDLRGYLHLPGVLSSDEVDALNLALDQHVEGLTTRSMQNSEREPLYPRSEFLLWHPGFRPLLDHPQIMPYLVAWVDPALRLDHCYGIFSKENEPQLSMHHGGTLFRHFAYYHVQNANIYNSLVVVSWALTRLPSGGGSFTCIPGSHKASFSPPRDVMSYQREADYVIEIGMEPEDALIPAVVARLHADGFPCHTILAGQGPLADVIRREVTRLGLSRYVFLLGHVADVSRLLLAADVVFIPSVGRIIASSGGSIGPRLAGGRLGHTAEPRGGRSPPAALLSTHQPSAYADCIEQLLTTPKLTRNFADGHDSGRSPN
jgi:hypothetical protein